MGSAIRTMTKRVITLLPHSWNRVIRRYHSQYSIRREPEPMEFAILRHLIREGCLIIDAGANLGVYTKYLSRYGPRCEVLSVEPIPTTFELLRANVRVLGLRNVRMLQCALSDRSQSVVMEIPEAAYGGPNHYLARIKYSDPSQPPLRTHFTVQTQTLDGILAGEQRRACLIKADVEMHELELIRGALAVLRRDHPAIYAEIQPDFPTKRTQREEIMRVLASEGYSPFWQDAEQLVRWTPQASAPLDLFFLTDDHVRELSLKGIRVVNPDHRLH